MGERIRKLGMKDDGGLVIYPDYMEDPAPVLDLVWMEQFGNGLSFKIKFGNILDGETVWFQQDQAHAIKTFQEGRTFSFSASYKF